MTEACGMGGGGEGSRQMVQGNEPNKIKVHETMPDGPLDATSRATNRALRVFIEIFVGGLRKTTVQMVLHSCFLKLPLVQINI